jgi:ABC-2 type transport system permease protein
MKRSMTILATAQKEIRHIMRDRLSMLVLFLLPGLIAGVFGFVLSFEIRELSVAVFSEKYDPITDQLFRKIDASPGFRVVKQLELETDILPAFAEQDIRMVVVAPAGYTDRLAAGRPPALHLFADATDPRLAVAAGNYLEQLAGDFLQESFPEGFLLTESQVPQIRYLYNPELRKEVMPVPGLMMIIFILVSSIMLSVSLVKEKEQGTVRLLALTSLSSGSLVLGKAIPYFGIAVFHILSVWTINRFLFGVQIAGNPLLFFLLCLLFASNAMAFGLLIASRVNHQLEVAILCWLFLFIPNVFLSGFIFPLRFMPPLMQIVAWLMPGTSFIEAYRGIVFRGSGLAGNARPFLLLLIQSLLVLRMAYPAFSSRRLRI